MTTTVRLDAVVIALLAEMRPLAISGPGGAIPDPSVHVTSFERREVGIGERRGTDLEAGYALRALKGVRLDAIVRFDLWESTPALLDTAIDNQRNAVLAQRDALRSAGVLALDLDELGDLAHQPTIPAWHRALDFRVLFEFHYEDDDGAESLLARIPIDVDPERLGSPDREHLEVTDAMMRWDDVEAVDLVVNAASGVDQASHLSVLAFLPAAWDGNPVVVSTEQGGAHAQHVFASVRDFVNALDVGDPVDLGGQTYMSGKLALPLGAIAGPVTLAGKGDELRVSHTGGAFDDVAVLYLRAHG